MDERWIAGEELIPTRDEILGFGSMLTFTDPHLLWTGPVNAQGYGRAPFRGKTVAAHRLAFALTWGRMPPPKWHIAHRCDLPACCAPLCLQLSTPQENNADQWRLRESGQVSRESRGLSPRYPDRGDTGRVMTP